MKNFSPALCIAVLLFFSCSKNADDNTGAGAYSFTMNAKQHIGEAAGTNNIGSNNIILTIAGASAAADTGALAIMINFPGGEKPGTYIDQLFTYRAGIDTTYIGTITVVLTKFNTGYAEGTFSGKASDQSTGAVFDITGGTFKASIGE